MYALVPVGDSDEGREFATNVQFQHTTGLVEPEPMEISYGEIESSLQDAVSSIQQSDSGSSGVIDSNIFTSS